MTTHDPVDVLLVEDTPEDQELTLRALEKNNLANNIVLANDGVEALEFLYGVDHGPKPRVVLLDLKLPRIDGLEVLRRIREDARTRSLPVVILTSSNEESDLIRSYELGVNSYIVKPVGFDNFVEAVAQLGFYWLLVNRPPPRP